MAGYMKTPPDPSAAKDYTQWKKDIIIWDKLTDLPKAKRAGVDIIPKIPIYSSHLFSGLQLLPGFFSTKTKGILQVDTFFNTKDNKKILFLNLKTIFRPIFSMLLFPGMQYPIVPGFVPSAIKIGKNWFKFRIQEFP